VCRRTGLERKRRCGWLGVPENQRAHPVWARGHVSTSMCPKSMISAESESVVEEYFVRRRMGSIRLDDLSARQAEAFLILEREIQTEKTNVQHNAGNALENLSSNLR
jgi:hypothetical protein